MLIVDATSMMQLMDEWHRFYTPPTYAPPPLTLSFRDYVLAERDLVINVPTRDRRQRVIRLTAEGEALFTRVWEISQRKYAAIDAAFGREEMRQLVASLNRLRTCLAADAVTQWSTQKSHSFCSEASTVASG